MPAITLEPRAAATRAASLQFAALEWSIAALSSPTADGIRQVEIVRTQFRVAVLGDRAAAAREGFDRRLTASIWCDECPDDPNTFQERATILVHQALILWHGNAGSA